MLWSAFNATWTDPGGVGGMRSRVVASYRDDAPRSSSETCFAIRALDAAGNLSLPSAPACAHTPDVTPPSVPSGVVATAASPTRILLSWNRSTDNFGVAGYEVTRDGALVASVKAPPAEEKALPAPGRYCYSVVALDAAGNRSAPSTSACTPTADPSLPLPASSMVAVRKGADELELRWEASPTKGVDYEVLWDGARKVPATQQVKSKVLGKTPLTRLKVFGRAARERHCYSVVARREAQASPESLPVCASANVADDAN
jgi:chitodextrinase